MIQTNFKYGVAGAFLVFAAGVFAGRFTAPNTAPINSQVAPEPTGATDADELQFDGTQSDMNDDASTMLERSQAKMELALTELRAQANKSSNSPAIALKFLQDSQDAWLKYKDVQMHLYWPSVIGKDGREPESDYGSAYPMCWSMTASDLVNNRVEDLRRILDIEEGDVDGPAWPRVLGVEEKKSK
jgi:uncharacterized protein YecT (DUF1311 family)